MVKSMSIQHHIIVIHPHPNHSVHFLYDRLKMAVAGWAMAAILMSAYLLIYVD